MWEATDDITIDAPAERVWAIVSDIPGHVELAGSGEVLGIRMQGPLEVGTTFEGDIATGEVGSFVSRNRIEEVDALRRLSWKSYPPLDEDETEDHQIEVTWWFALAPEGQRTHVEHGFHVPDPNAGAKELGEFLERTDRITTIKQGMRRTLENLKARAEVDDRTT